MKVNWTLVIISALLLATGVALVALGHMTEGLATVIPTVTLLIGSFLKPLLERGGAP